MQKHPILMTPEGETLSGQPWPEYPRPLLKRDSFFNLNGKWEFCAQAGGEPVYGQKIIVPFVPEATLSGIGEHYPQSHTLYYRKEFILPESFVRGRVILHFGAVNQFAKVSLNGTCLGGHTGGYEPFSFDITDHLQDKNILEVQVRSELDKHILPWGKQSEKRGGMWYTPVTGIWQTVWLESVPEIYIRDIRIENTLDSVKIAVSGVSDGEILLDNARYPLKDGAAEIRIENPLLWTPETPHLYRFSILLCAAHAGNEGNQRHSPALPERKALLLPRPAGPGLLERRHLHARIAGLLRPRYPRRKKAGLQHPAQAHQN